MTPPTLPAAVLWDMDGTLVNTEPYWIASEIELAERDGGHWTHEDGLTLVGNDLRYSAAQLRARAGIRGSDEEIIDDLLRLVIAKARTEGAPWRPGALDLLTALRTAGIPCALVTMSYRSLADVILEHLPVGTFSAVITGDMVAMGKPHPEPYLTAAGALLVRPQDCVAIEDSRAGIASAEAAGVHTLGVEFFQRIEAAPGRSRAHSLERIGIDELRRIAAGEAIDEYA